MLSVDFQRKVYEAYKQGKTIRHREYEYTIAYNACATIHTWIIRRKCGGEYHWLQPLESEVR